MNKQIEKVLKGLKEGDKVNINLNTMKYENVKYITTNNYKGFMVIELNNKGYSIPLNFIVSIERV